MFPLFRLTLLYNTILFLVREPMRKANILNKSIPQFVNLLWLRWDMHLWALGILVSTIINMRTLLI